MNTVYGSNPPPQEAPVVPPPTFETVGSSKPEDQGVGVAISHDLNLKDYLHD